MADLLAPFDRAAPDRAARDRVAAVEAEAAEVGTGTDVGTGSGTGEAGDEGPAGPSRATAGPVSPSAPGVEDAPPPPASARLPDAPPAAPAHPPRPAAHRPFVFFARPALYDDTTARPRPVAAWRRPRAAAAAACAVLGLGLIGGAVTGSWLTGESDAAGSSRSAYATAGALWHSLPVDALFPPAIKGGGAGPGGADRVWNRVAVAPDSGCAKAFDPLLRKALAPVGCQRLLRATYTDATKSHLTTVGLLFTTADADAMHALRTRFGQEGLDRRTDLMPRAYAAPGTPAASFGDAQRATWTLSVLPDAPVVAYAVSGFADGRAVTEPEPAADAMKAGAASAPAQAGLGHDAKGIADRVERSLRKTATAAPENS
ncbi:hypothetical protein C9F11_08390 [Streptomyces sp. YIM 121038]|uniref:hypothetical protein n=1 Tax=Streptomyces sp. YIM 121038 TaxID=2136401 RepID=UPI001162D46B|nr:hypothetical protein [Streptomyces sp. YIM 121038]QCX75367.1 hypothetical protein C9F11_08390 [Streptomyces sp. YIM 121038]